MKNPRETAVLRLRSAGRGVLAATLVLGLAACGSWGGKGTDGAAREAARQGGPVAGVPTSSGSYLASLYAESVGETGKAADFLARALAEDPTNLSLTSRAYVLMASEGRTAEAATLARRLIEHNPNAPIAAVTLVVEDIKAGDYAAAERRLRLLPREGVNRVIVPMLLAWTLVGQDEPDAALSELGVLADNSGFAALYELHAGLINQLGGRWPAAERHLRQALDGGERMALRVVQALGAFYERTGRTDEARALYERYRRQNVDSLLVKASLRRLESAATPAPFVASAREGAAEALFNIASALDQESTSQMALIYARMAVDLRSDFAVGRLLVGDILTTQKRYEKANAVFAGLDPGTPAGTLARLRLALNLEELGETERAVSVLRELAAEHPDWPEVLIDLGDVLRAHKRFDEAIVVYDRAIESVGDLEERHWALLYSRGIALERAGRWPSAETDFLRALELRPEQPYVLNYLGYSWVEQGINLHRAKQMLERAVELRPNEGYIVDSLGWVFYRMGEYQRAVRQLERAVELRPNDATINDHLGDAYWKVGRETEARFQWRRALALDPEPEQVAAIEAKLERGLVAASVGEHGS